MPQPRAQRIRLADLELLPRKVTRDGGENLRHVAIHEGSDRAAHVGPSPEDM